jgi:hypothetical protein
VLSTEPGILSAGVTEYRVQRPEYWNFIALGGPEYKILQSGGLKLQTKTGLQVQHRLQVQVHGIAIYRYRCN